MILDTIDNISRHTKINPNFQSAARFLIEGGYDALEDGRYEIDGDRVFALVSTSTGRGRAKTILEAHRKYIDIQFCVAGCDEIGIRPTRECHNICEEYDPSRDIMFFADTPQEWITLKGNNCAILFPEDAHAPLSSDVAMKKIVIKVAVR